MKCTSFKTRSDINGSEDQLDLHESYIKSWAINIHWSFTEIPGILLGTF